MKSLRAKSVRLTAYLDFCSAALASLTFTIITPKDPQARGCQLSLSIHQHAEQLLQRLRAAGFICDLRHPHVIRLAPVPLYNTFSDVYQLYAFLKQDGK